MESMAATMRVGDYPAIQEYIKMALYENHVMSSIPHAFSGNPLITKLIL